MGAEAVMLQLEHPIRMIERRRESSGRLTRDGRAIQRRERRRLQGKMVAAAKSSLGGKKANPSTRTCRMGNESFPLDFSFASVADKLDSFYATY